MKLNVRLCCKRLFVVAVILLTGLFNRAFAQPNECTGVVTPLTVYTNTCGGATAGTTVGATQSMVSCDGAATADDDVWFSFVQNGGYPTITVAGGAGMGNLNNPVFEVFSGACGSLTSVFCDNSNGGNTEAGTVPGTANLINGNTYYVRVYSTANVTGRGTFTICITKPTPPVNDNGATATLLTPAATCVTGAGGSQAGGNLVNTTNSGIAGVCGGASDDDVWYSFVAAYPTQTVTVSGIGNNILVNGSGIGGSAVMEVFSSSTNAWGGVFTNIVCGSVSGTNLVAFANSLTVGNTYFVRVYSTNSIALANNAGFNVCVTNPFTGAPTLFFGKSFINITKGTGGGTVETGDVLEVRAAITLRPTSILDSCGFTDNIPVGTSFIPGSLAILTNEGKIYKSFTDAVGDDEGSIVAGAIDVKLGYNQIDNPARPFRRGRLRSGNIPTVGGSHVILVSYRVTVTAALNTVINLGGGTFTYSLITNITNVITNNFNQNNVIVYTNTGLCSNATGVNVLDAGIGGDFNGTFGTGNTINRVASPNMPPGYTYVTQSGGRPADFTYTITNNMSNNAAGYSTTDAWPKPEVPNVHRIFGVWDVIGDHSGAADPLAGNPATDTTNGGTGGYMLLVNAAYTLDTVFTYPITGLCPNTYYEISFWVRNVCSRCGIDSVNRGASGVTVPVGYIPTDPGDSSGVRPNLSFSINGVNHYTTGNMTYTGQWVQKGFVFRTAPGQTNIVFAIANNAPGGGGNDWALDDIRLSTCTPNLDLVPSGNAPICENQQLDVAADVISYFDNYAFYQWQVSHDNGATFTDTLSMGTGTPLPDAGNYVYTASFPSFLAVASQHLTQYRIRVATDPGNLYGGCSFFNSVNIVIMVNNCQWVLNTKLLSFDAVLKNGHGVLSWKTSDELAATRYEVQRSSDGVHFETIGIVNALNQVSSIYTFTDPLEIQSYAYYRIVIQEPQGRENSRVRLLNVTDVPYDILTVVNPFSSKLSFDVSMPKNSFATIILSDQHGRTVRYVRQAVVKGMNHVELDKLGILPGGTYVLQVVTDSGVKAKRVVKVNN